MVQKSYNQAADDYEDESMDEYGDQGQQQRAVRRRRGGQRRNEKENSGAGYEYDNFDDDDDHGDVAGGGDEVAEEEEGKTSKPLFFDYQQQQLQQEQERFEQEQEAMELEGRGFRGCKLPMTVVSRLKHVTLFSLLFEEPFPLTSTTGHAVHRRRIRHRQDAAHVLRGG